MISTWLEKYIITFSRYQSVIILFRVVRVEILLFQVTLFFMLVEI